MSAARQALWRTAEAMSSAMGPDLSLRGRRLAARRHPTLSFGDLDRSPAWTGFGAEARERLARLTGAVAVSAAWRRTVDGPTLRRAVEAVGEAGLDALLSLPAGVQGDLEDKAAGSGDPAALERLGGRILLAEIQGAAPALAPRLRSLLGTPPTVGPRPDPALAASIRRTAEGLIAQLDTDAGS